MALMDRFRDRMRTQRPIGAAQEMENRGGQQPGRLEPNQLTEQDLDSMERGRTAEEMDAFMLGQKMGAKSLLEMHGQSVPGPDAGANGGRIMTKERLNSATNTLLRYRSGKSSVNKRVIAAQQWWKLKNWEQIRLEKGFKGAMAHPSNTGWLWNCIVGKHADAMDSYPEPIILPRSQDDKEEANRLSKILPVELEINDFENTYSKVMWQKMQEGTGVYGVFWDTGKLNGLGDISITKVNILNLYWEPGISDIEESKNVFYTSLADIDELVEKFPELAGRTSGMKLFVDKYKTDDSIDMSNKAIVVDWYYKKQIDRQTVLHYCKFVGDFCIYSSEEEGLVNGYYEDGEYPFVLDPLFPVEGSPAGYGYIDIAKDEQANIDLLSQAMTLNAVMRSTPRYFERKDGSINEEEFADWTKMIVHTNGNLGQDALRSIEVQNMGSDAHNMLQQKIDAIKFITGNTDVNNGGVPSGVTAASAIAALKEDSGRSSKDSTKGSYRAYRNVSNKCIERIRQFMSIPRQFRIVGQDGQEEFTTYSNAGLQVQQIYNLPGQEPALRLPVFDLEIRAQRENAYTKMSQNELALQFYDKGLLNPQMTDQAMIVLDMMEFRGKEELKQKIIQQGTMQDALMKISQVALTLAQEYRPELAEQLAPVVQGLAQGNTQPMTLPSGGTQQLSLAPDSVSEPPHDARENQIVRRAAERSANASRPS